MTPRLQVPWGVPGLQGSTTGSVAAKARWRVKAGPCGLTRRKSCCSSNVCAGSSREVWEYRASQFVVYGAAELHTISWPPPTADVSIRTGAQSSGRRFPDPMTSCGWPGARLPGKHPKDQFLTSGCRYLRHLQGGVHVPMDQGDQRNIRHVVTVRLFLMCSFIQTVSHFVTMCFEKWLKKTWLL